MIIILFCSQYQFKCEERKKWSSDWNAALSFHWNPDNVVNWFSVFIAIHSFPVFMLFFFPPKWKESNFFWSICKDLSPKLERRGGQIDRTQSGDSLSSEFFLFFFCVSIFFIFWKCSIFVQFHFDESHSREKFRGYKKWNFFRLFSIWIRTYFIESSTKNVKEKKIISKFVWHKIKI